MEAGTTAVIAAIAAGVGAILSNLGLPGLWKSKTEIEINKDNLNADKMKLEIEASFKQLSEEMEKKHRADKAALQNVIVEQAKAYEVEKKKLEMFIIIISSKIGTLFTIISGEFSDKPNVQQAIKNLEKDFAVIMETVNTENNNNFKLDV